jgi:nucleoside-diphosphate-sugar epimerase
LTTPTADIGKTRRVVITGAAGNLGQKLCRHLQAKGGYDLVLLDRKNGPHEGVVCADLSNAEDDWERYFEGADCVVHLAAVADSSAPWPALFTNNVVATINVFEAAVEHGVGRVVFASSLQTMFGHEGKVRRITPDMPTEPLNPYGVSKAVGEALARDHARRRGLSVICLRIGQIRRGEHRPIPGIDALGPQHRFLSNADFCQGFERAIEVEDIDYAVLNLTSRNSGSPWDLSATESSLGYRPLDGLATLAPPLWRRAWGRLRRML